MSYDYPIAIVILAIVINITSTFYKIDLIDINYNSILDYNMDMDMDMDISFIICAHILNICGLCGFVV